MANDALRSAEQLAHQISSMNSDELLQYCRLVVEMEEMLEALTAPAPAETATKPEVLEDPPPTTTEEPEPPGIFHSGPDVLERVLERQEMKPHRPRFYTDKQDRFRRGWR
jgi:hypothetical protein